MLKRFGILILFILCSCADLLSQQLSHQVLVPLAGITTNEKISYSQTVGETAVDILGYSWYVFTQGFQQPGIKISDDARPVGTGVKVYPNPADDFITIEMFGESARSFRVEFINMTGTVVMSEKKVFGDQFWYKDPMCIEDLIKGLYLVRIISDDNFVNRTFKIEKL